MQEPNHRKNRRCDMLALRSYGIVSPTSQSVQPRLKLEIPLNERIEEGPFSVDRGRRRLNPLFRTSCNDYGRYIDFCDIGIVSPMKSSPYMRSSGFTKNYLTGPFIDTSIGSLVKRKQLERLHKDSEAERNTELNEKKEKRRAERNSRRQTKACVTIQKHARGYLCRRQLKEKYRTENDSKITTAIVE